MKNIITVIAFFIMLSTQAQNCYQWAKDMREKATLVSSENSWFSDAIDNVDFYEMDGNYYAFVKFTNNPKTYVYGTLTKGDLYAYKWAWSKGKAFNTYIRPHKITLCGNTTLSQLVNDVEKANYPEWMEEPIIW